MTTTTHCTTVDVLVLVVGGPVCVYICVCVCVCCLLLLTSATRATLIYLTLMQALWSQRHLAATLMHLNTRSVHSVSTISSRCHTEFL